MLSGMAPRGTAVRRVAAPLGGALGHRARCRRAPGDPSAGHRTLPERPWWLTDGPWPPWDPRVGPAVARRGYQADASGDRTHALWRHRARTL